MIFSTMNVVTFARPVLQSCILGSWNNVKRRGNRLIKVEMLMDISAYKFQIGLNESHQQYLMFVWMCDSIDRQQFCFWCSHTPNKFCQAQSSGSKSGLVWKKIVRLQDCNIVRCKNERLLHDCNTWRLQDCKIARLQDWKIERLQDSPNLLTTETHTAHTS